MAVTGNRATVVSVFDSVDEAQRAIRDLVDAGVQREQISMVARNRENTGTTTTTGNDLDGRDTTDGTTVGENIAGGTLFGGLGGLLIGLGALAIPGVGPVLAAGPLAAPLAATLGGALTGAIGGGIIGALKDAGVPEDDANFYAEHVRRGGVLVTVTTDEANHDRIEDILHRHGAVDVDERSTELRNSGWNRFDHDAEPITDFNQPRTNRTANLSDNLTGDRTTNRAENLTGDRAIPVVQENLNVGKREVQRGGVRVYNRMTEQPVEEQVRLREEHVHVDRRPVDRPVNPGEMEAFRDQSIELTETAEEPVVNKTARVVEEVVVGKETTERTETIRDTVRRTDVDVQQMGTSGHTASNLGNFDNDYRSDFQNRYGNMRGAKYDTYAPAYQYGSRIANDPRYQGRSFEDVEDTLRTDYLRNNPNSTWDNMKGAVRYGWERVTGQRGASPQGVTPPGSRLDNYEQDFRGDFQNRYGNMRGASYDTYAPAYQYGSRMASDNRYQGRSFDDVEDTIRTDYLRNNPNSNWDNMKGAVRYGWEKVTGKRA